MPALLLIPSIHAPDEGCLPGLVLQLLHPRSERPLVLEVVEVAADAGAAAAIVGVVAAAAPQARSTPAQA